MITTSRGDGISSLNGGVLVLQLRSRAHARVGARRLQSVVLQYGLVALVEGATLALAQIVRRSRQVVAPDHLGNSAQLPQRSL